MGSGIPIIYNSLTTLIPAYPSGVYDIEFPDVCLYDTSGTTDLFFVSYLNVSTGYIDIQTDRWPNIANGSPTMFNTLLSSVIPSITVVDPPRIACGIQVSRDHVAVIYSDQTDVAVWTYNGGVEYVLTDGSTFPPTISGANSNSMPVLSYDGKTSKILRVGWIYDNYAVPPILLPPLGAGYHPGYILPIGLNCQLDGYPAGNGNYLDIPRTPSTDSRVLSLCGRSSNIYVGASWWDLINVDVSYKEVGNTSGTWRTTKQELSVDNDCKIQIFDIQGRILLEQINYNFNPQLFFNDVKYNSGIYIIKIISPNGETNKKYFKM